MCTDLGRMHYPILRMHHASAHQFSHEYTPKQYPLRGDRKIHPELIGCRFFSWFNKAWTLLEKNCKEVFETVWTIHSIAPRQLNGQLIRRASKQEGWQAVQDLVKELLKVLPRPPEVMATFLPAADRRLVGGGATFWHRLQPPTHQPHQTHPCAVAI